MINYEVGARDESNNGFIITFISSITANHECKVTAYSLLRLAPAEAP